jgi:hypothetical protein
MPLSRARAGLNPHLQKGEEAGIPRLIEKLHIQRQWGSG